MEQLVKGKELEKKGEVKRKVERICRKLAVLEVQVDY